MLSNFEGRSTHHDAFFFFLICFYVLQKKYEHQLGEESYSSLDLASTKLNKKEKEEGTWKRCKKQGKLKNHIRYIYFLAPSWKEVLMNGWWFNRLISLMKNS